MYTHLLVPIDGSELSERAAQASLELARKLGARVTGVVAEAMPPLPGMGTAMAAYTRDVENHQARTEAHAREVLAKFNASVEPIDVVREICVFADRSDISEEIVRLRSHLAQFAQALQAAESAGRKLEFICQEMGRETNTIGSKANDAEISHEVVEIKTALERIREQIQNVE